MTENTSELGNMEGWLTMYREARDAVTKWEEVKQQCRDRLVQFLEEQGAALGALDGQPVCKRSVISSRRFATARFRAAHPELAEEFTADTETTRFELIGE